MACGSYMATSWTDEELVEAVKSSKGISEVVLKLYSVYCGGNFNTIRKHIKRMGLNTSHFGRKKPTNKNILTKNSAVSSNSLRRAYLKISEYECKHCGNKAIHNGKPLTLQIDHIDGNRSNNEPSNLRWLCPNCHSQTPTFGRQKSKPRKIFKDPTVKKNCSNCKKSFDLNEYRLKGKIGRGQKNFYCSPGCASPKRVDRKKVIETYGKTGSYLGTARILGVSDLTIRKIVKQHQ